MDSSIVVFLFFLLVSLFIGIRSMYRTSTFQQYAVGSKGFTTAGIVAAILTISYGTPIFYAPLNIYVFLLLIGRAISYFIIGNLLSHRLYLFFDNCSVAEIMGKLYGITIRKIVAICGLCHSVSISAIQIKGFSMAIAWLFDIKEHYSLCGATIFVMLSIGSLGINSSTLVSMIRCATFGILLPTLAWILWKNLLNQYNLDQFRLTSAISNAWYSLINTQISPVQYVAFLIVFVIPTLHPAQIQQVLMAESATQVRRSFNYAGLFALVINILLLWVTLLLNKTCAHLMISDMFLLGTVNAYRWLKGLFVMGTMALTISAAGAYLHAATVLVVNDIQDVRKKDRTSAMNFSLYTVTIGLLPAFLAWYIKDLSQILWIGVVLFKPIVSVPLLVSLIGMHLHKYAVLTSMLASTISIIAWEYFAPGLWMYRLPYYMLINLASLMLAQALLKRFQRPFDRIHTPLSSMLSQEEAPTISPLWSRVSTYILHKITEFNFWDYFWKQLPKDNLSYVIFSFYITVTGYCSFYTFSSNAIWSARLEAMVLFPSLFVATFFLIYASVPTKPYLRKIVSLVWPLSNFYFLFLVGSGMLILSKFTHLQAIILMLNIYLAVFRSSLVSIFLRFSISTVAVCMLLPYFSNNVELIDAFLNLNINGVYVILMIFILLSSALYYKRSLYNLYVTIQELRNGQEEQNARQFFRKQQVEALAYESRYVITQLHNQLLRSIQSAGRNLVDSIEAQATRLRKYFDGIFTHLKHNLYLATNWISTDQLLEECFDAIKINNIYHSPYVTINTEHLYIQCDIERIKSLIINSLYSCKLHESINDKQDKDIYIYINDTQLGYRLTLLQGRIQKINAISLMLTTTTKRPTILPIYKVGEMADVQILDKAKEKDKLDAENQHIVNAHYGYCEITHADAEITHLYVIPINVQEITKAFTALSPVVYTQSVKSDPTSIEKESAFLQKVKQKKILDLQIIMDSLQLIKIYYASQRRKTGELFYLHPMEVASILLDITEDSNVIIAGLVHDVVQNTPLTQAGLHTMLGEEITQIVLSAASLDKQLSLKDSDYLAYIQEVIHNKNHNAILVKLADALHNVKTIHGHDVEKQIKKATLIQKFYVPLAQQMQLTKIADELHFHAAKVLDIGLI